MVSVRTSIRATKLTPTIKARTEAWCGMVWCGFQFEYSVEKHTKKIIECE